MIEVYYSIEIGSESLLYYKNGDYLWSDYMEYYPAVPKWELDNIPPSIPSAPEVYIKLFEIEE